MKNGNKSILFIGTSLIAAFLIWTILVSYIDVRAIGPQGSRVGFSTLNGYVHKTLGVNILLYTVTDLMGLVPIGIAAGFAVLGLIQLIERKSLVKVDRSLLLLGTFYVVVIFFYLLFEFLVINYRPVLIDGYLEASYPSSTTLLTCCIMPTAIMQFNRRIANVMFKRCIVTLSIAFTAFTVIARLISGVHWLSDIIGGSLLSAGLVMIYYFLIRHHSPRS